MSVTVTRRGFLQAMMAAAAGAAAIDPEMLVWVPKPMIVVPEMPALTWEGIDSVLKSIYTPQRMMQLLNSESLLAGYVKQLEADGVRWGDNPQDKPHPPLISTVGGVERSEQFWRAQRLSSGQHRRRRG